MHPMHGVRKELSQRRIMITSSFVGTIFNMSLKVRENTDIRRGSHRLVICGKGRIIPAFPGAGGSIDDGILNAG